MSAKPGTKRVLLHICCGPCAIHPVRSLTDQGFEVVGLYYNPNIQPLSEYLRRRDGLLETLDKLEGEGRPVKLILKDDEYDPKIHLRAVTHREEQRCFYCYSLRLERTLSIAKRGGFDFFSTTLLYSKFQKHEMIRSLGVDLAGKGATGFFYQDFRQGWDEGVTTSKAWNIYRQQYCGCLYSEFERYRKGLKAESG